MAYNKTNWQNAPSTNTPINANNLNKIEEGIYQNSLKADQVGDLSTLETTIKNNLVNAINEINERNIMTIGLSTNTSSILNQKIPFDITLNSIGNKLTINNNGIKIGSGVSKVLVSGQIQIQYDSTNRQYSGKAYLNDNEITGAYASQYKGGTAPITLTISPTLVDVIENDIIYLYLTFGQSVIRPESYLTVEVIQ